MKIGGQRRRARQLVHSLALTPGEATLIAIADWTRTVSASTAESIAQMESLAASTKQNRALFRGEKACSQVASVALGRLLDGLRLTLWVTGATLALHRFCSPSRGRLTTGKICRTSPD